MGNCMKMSRIVLPIMLLSMAATDTQARVYSGLEVFLAKYVGMVKGKRVGLVTNQTGVDAKLNSAIDLFRAHPDIKLVALFAPEHGIRGNLKAGETVPGGKDPRSGVPIYTLYGGKDHRPPKEALDKIDVIVYDIQDVGSRAYTYIWHLAECMSAAAENDKEVIVLDRPNPFGAKTMDGPITEKQFLSFIGLYPIPRVYGLTVGELAVYLNTEEKIRCRLTVIPMQNYFRGMRWEQTGLPWVPPSPNIPNVAAAYGFAATGTIGETGCMNIACGTSGSFQVVAAGWMNSKASAAALNALKLPGVLFVPLEAAPDMSIYAKFKTPGIFICVTDPVRFKPSTTEVAILSHLKMTYPNRFSWTPDGNKDRLRRFDKAAGTSSVRNGIEAGWSYSKIAAAWQAPMENFRAKAQKYMIYK